MTRAGEGEADFGPACPYVSRFGFGVGPLRLRSRALTGGGRRCGVEWSKVEYRDRAQ